MPTTVKQRWLTDKNGDKIAPKTLISQVVDVNGTPLDTKLENDILAVKNDAKEYVDDKLENYYSKNEINNLELITVEDIDEIWGETIQLSSEVTF